MKNNARSWNRVLAVVVASVALGGMAKADDIAYSNTTNYEGSFYQSQNEYGDEITLSGTPNNQVLTTLKLEYYLSHNASGDENAIVNIYANNAGGTGANQAPGTLLYDGSGSPIPLVKGNDNTIVLSGLNVAVPSDITFTVQFTGIQAGEQAGLVFYGTPEVGSSANDIWEKINGVWTAEQFPGITANFGAQVLTVPEPTTIAYALFGGLTLLGVTAYRRRS